MEVGGLVGHKKSPPRMTGKADDFNSWAKPYLEVTERFITVTRNVEPEIRLTSNILEECHTIQAQTGHQSLTVLRRYIRDGELFRENAG